MQGPYLTIHVGCGLGNQLFMIAAGFALQNLSPGVSLLFCDADDAGERPKSWREFLADCPLITAVRVPKLPDVKWSKIGDTDHAFSYRNFLGEIRRNARDNISTEIIGYFQNKRYLPGREFVLKLFNIELKKIQLREKVAFSEYDTTCSIHFRLGDYKKYYRTHILLSDEYYAKAIENVKKNQPQIKKLLVFNETEDQKEVENRMLYLTKDKNFEVQYATAFQLKDWEEMLLMSLCSFNIIANSTFSWWGAYFNRTDCGVIYPELWLNHPDVHNLDIAQKGWIQV